MEWVFVSFQTVWDGRTGVQSGVVLQKSWARSASVAEALPVPEL
jgi:hypothetical protein